jgi:hypothetical protein
VLTSFDTFDLPYTGRNLRIEHVTRTLQMAAARTLCR